MSKGAVLILGARSDIGMAVAHKYAALGHPVQLAARNVESLDRAKTDIEVRHRVAVSLHSFDALAFETHAGFVDGLPELPDIAVTVVGYMGEQADNERDLAAASLVMRSNFEGPASIMAELANRFEERRSGTLIGVSSVAGERGRATNYVYGASKAGFTAFLSGLRNRLAKKGVHVLTVLPGFVDTQMTAGMDLPAKLTAQPDQVANKIASAAAAGRNVIYVKSIWWVIMTIIRNIPEQIFKGMKI